MDVRPHASIHPPSIPHPSPNADEIRSALCGLTRELGRPLISLRAGLDLLLADQANPIPVGQRRHVEAMCTLCEDLLGLTREYRDYAMLVEGRKALTFGRYTIGALVRELARLSSALLGDGRVDWDFSPEDETLAVATDASRCLQLFERLLQTAVSDTSPGSTIHLSARGMAPSWQVVITATPPAPSPKDPLEPTDPPAERPLAGALREDRSGIQLAVCRELANQLGGRLAVSRPRGTTVSVVVELPIDGVEPPW